MEVEEVKDCFVQNVEVEHDDSLFADQMAVEMEDGYEWRGPWLLAYAMVSGAAGLRLIKEDAAITVKRLRAGTIAYRVLSGVSQTLTMPAQGVTDGQETEDSVPASQELEAQP